MVARALVLACLLLAGLAGCAEDEPNQSPTGLEPTPAPSNTAPPSPLEDGFVPARVLLNSTIRGAPFGSENSWQPTRLEVQIKENQENWTRGWPYQFTRPEIQFGHEFVATIGWGPFNETGAHVEVIKAGRTKDGNHTVELERVRPGPGCTVGKAPMVHAVWLAFERTGPTPTNITVSTSERIGSPCPMTRPDRVYHVLSINGEIAQSPPHQGSMSVCGRPGGSFTRLDTVNRQAYLSTYYAGHDFNWTSSWLIVHDDVNVVQDSSGCDLTFIASHEGPYNSTLGGQTRPIEAADDGLRVGDRMLAENESLVVHVDYTTSGSQNGNPVTWHYAGDVTYRYYGAWHVRDIVEVDDEGNTWGDLGGFWAK